MTQELGPEGCNNAASRINVSHEGLRPPVTFDEYMARLSPDTRTSIPREVLSRMRNRWRTHDKIRELGQADQVNEGDSIAKPGPKESFEEYHETKLARATSQVGGVSHQVIQLVREHWRSGQWNAPSGTNTESD